MIRYKRASVDGNNVFYREAGPLTASTILLLHGFPTSSHMFRNVIPLLAEAYHVVAPDLPGFGFSDSPDRKDSAIPSNVWPRSSSEVAPISWTLSPLGVR